MNGKARSFARVHRPFVQLHVFPSFFGFPTSNGQLQKETFPFVYVLGHFLQLHALLGGGGCFSLKGVATGGGVKGMR